MITTARLSSENSSSWKADASFAMLATSSSTMAAAMRSEVSTIESVGVPKRPSRSRLRGTSRSRAMASGYRDADRIPALPVDAKAAMAATTTRTTPSPAGSQSKNAAAAVATGVRSSYSSAAGRMATMIVTPTKYTNDAVASESIMPSGMFRSGSRTSSATLATLVSPAYETNTKPTVPRKPVTPAARNGVNCRRPTSTTFRDASSATPCTRKRASTASRITTSTR